MDDQTTKMMDCDMSAESDGVYENVFCNPVFEPDEEMEANKGNFKIDIYVEPTKLTTASHRAVRDCLPVLSEHMRGRGALKTSAVLMVTVLCVTLLLVLKQVKSKDGEITHLDFEDRTSQNVNSSPTVLHPTPRSTLPLPEREPTLYTRCGGLLTDSAGTFSSPHHPSSYPPDSHCVWEIRLASPLLVQIQLSSLAIEGPSPCLFDWLEVREETEKTSTVTRFCGNVPPPTLNTNSSSVSVSFHSDGSISGSGFIAQYHSVLPGQKSCSRNEFLCDDGLCLFPAFVCDNQNNCADRTDETNCSREHTACGGKITGEHGSLSSPNHPKPYPHQQLCTWQISVEDGQLIRLSFQNFSLETQDVCEFDYVEVYDGAETFHSTALGRFCGSALPPDLTSSGSVMTVVFVADEGVADSGFYALFKAMTRSEKSCSPVQFSCGSGECLHQDWVCDGWSDCADAADEQDCLNATYPPFTSSCEPIRVEMCHGLSYNLTSFPNIWLSVSDQREAASLLHKYRNKPLAVLALQVLQELGCFDSLRRLVCGLLVPLCSAEIGVLQPCRSVCSAAELQCGPALALISLNWPFNCLLLPDSQEPLHCSLP